MRTEYYCPKCKINFFEPKIPNINKIHKRCGSMAKIIRYISEKEENENDD